MATFFPLLELSSPYKRSPVTLTILASPMESDDETLACAAASGSRAAFTRLVDRYAGRIVATLERKLGDHSAAMDAGQETWIRVHRSLPRYDSSKRFRPWLLTIALNAARDEGRRRKRSPIQYAEKLPGHLEASRSIEESEAIESSLAAVAEPYRTAVLLVDSQGLDYAEAAACCGCPVGTMKSRVARGRAAFRDHWRTHCGATRSIRKERM